VHGAGAAGTAPATPPLIANGETVTRLLPVRRFRRFCHKAERVIGGKLYAADVDQAVAAQLIGGAIHRTIERGVVRLRCVPDRWAALCCAS